jgi:hypothetical protein
MSHLLPENNDDQTPFYQTKNKKTLFHLLSPLNRRRRGGDDRCPGRPSTRPKRSGETVSIVKVLRSGFTTTRKSIKVVVVVVVVVAVVVVSSRSSSISSRAG